MFISFTYIFLVVDPMTEEGEQAVERGGTQDEVDQQNAQGAHVEHAAQREDIEQHCKKKRYFLEPHKKVR